MCCVQETVSVHLFTALSDGRVTKATDSPALPACCAATWEYHNSSAFRLQVGGSENSQIVKMPICHVPTFIGNERGLRSDGERYTGREEIIKRELQDRHGWF